MRNKLLILFLLINIVPSVGLGLLVDYTVNRIIGKQVNENTLQLIGKVNESLEFYLSNMQNMTYLISFNSEIKRFVDVGNTMEFSPDELVTEEYNIRKFLQGFTTLYSEIAAIMIVNSNGEYISNELYARNTQRLTGESWYKEAVSARGIFQIIGKPQHRNITSHAKYKEDEVVTVVRAMINPDTHEVEGVVLIDLKLRVIAEAVKNVSLGKYGYLLVMDQQGGRIYSPENAMISDIPEGWITDPNGGTFSQLVEGESYQFIYRKSPFTNWTTIGVFSSSESVAEVQEIRFYVIMSVYFLVMLGTAPAIYLAYSMSRPINQLMSLMQMAENGNLSVRYEEKRRDEVGHLGRSFNTMLTQLNRLLKLTERQGRQKVEAELRSLQAHIRPHFLYNTLDTIHWMARKKGAEDVAEVVQSLSKLFRLGLSKGHDIIPLTDEIEHIQSYLLIQKTRYKDKLNFSLQVSQEVQSVYVLKLVLQPILENAIYHGIKERRGPGHIEITAEEHEGMLVLRVRDDGVGMSEHKLSLLRVKMDQVTQVGSEQDYESNESLLSVSPKEGQDQIGYGLYNVQARIQLTFGSQYGMSIESELGMGTTVTIVHPLLHNSYIEKGDDSIG